MTRASTPTFPLDDLANRLDGRLVRPGDADWDESRRAWNLAVDQQPEAIVYAASAQDVIAAVRAARVEGLRVAPQSTGHSAAPMGDLAGALLLRTDTMRRVEIDPVRRTARAEAGARWGDVTRPAAEHGLAALAGSSPGVGVSGYLLGGGMSWLARSHGLAANSLTALDVVTADGVLRTVDSDTEPDLFWALRGGGGDFGVVTALEFALYPMETIYAGALFFPMDRAAEVLHAWRSWSSTVPDAVTSLGRVLRFPPLEELPEQLRGQNFVVVEAACQLEADEADRLLAPLRALNPVQDTFAVIKPVELSALHMDPVDPVPCAGDGALLSALPEQALAALLDVITSEAAAPLLSFELRHLGGMLEPGRMEGGAVCGVDAAFAAYAVGMAPTPESVDLVDRAAAGILGVLRPWTCGSYINFAERRTDADALFGSARSGLAAIKSVYDPTDLIRSNHPVRWSETGR